MEFNNDQKTVFWDIQDDIVELQRTIQVLSVVQYQLMNKTISPKKASQEKKKFFKLLIERVEGGGSDEKCTGS